jgi:hypothetical protein
MCSYRPGQEKVEVGRHPDSTLSGSDLVGGAISGGVAPGYLIDPLRGSRVDSAEDILGVQKVGKKPSGPPGLTFSKETSNSSSFWRACDDTGVERPRSTLRRYSRSIPASPMPPQTSSKTSGESGVTPHRASGAVFGPRCSESGKISSEFAV